MKKALKITGISLLTLIIIIIAIPFLFQGKIQEALKGFINENINAKVEFSDVSLSFIQDFPNAHVSISDLRITNYKPFEGETLLSSKNIALSISIKELIKSEDEGPIAINTIALDETLITLKTDKYGNTNYDIAKASDDENKDTTADTKNESSSFSLNLKDYKINNSAFTYFDEASKINFSITELFHEGHGVFSASTSELVTKTGANISFSMDSTSYFSNNPIKLDAIIGLDLDNSKYTFKDNKALINQLPIEFNGFVQLLEDGQNIDISFENPESDFRNFLALVPKAYSKEIENVKTTGNFKVKGIIKGIATEETIPTLDISFISNNASFKYPDLPKPVTDISINTEIKNTTGKIEDTYIDIKTLNFKIDEDVFKSSASLKNITTNPLIAANIDGSLNLSKLTQVYPIELDEPLTGTLKAKINTAFDMEAIETNAYKRIKTDGSLHLTNFNVSSEELPNPIHLTSTKITFNTDKVTLNEFKAKSGKSDLNASGTLENILGFVLSDNTLKGRFALNSNLFRVSDFLATEEPSSKESTPKETAPTETKNIEATEPIKIPAFLDCEIKANAKNVVYDNLNLTDVKGDLLIKDQKITLKDVTSKLFNGLLSLSGEVSTQQEKPTFDLNLGASGFDIATSFKKSELLQSLAPIAEVLQGKLNTALSLSGDLDNEFLPNLNSISGNGNAELIEASVKKDNKSKLINTLEESLNFVDFSKLNLNDIKTQFTFSDGKIKVKPFDLKYKDIDMKVSGAHSFEKNLDYSAVLNVPAKYLGSDVNRLIGKIDDKETNNIAIPVTANIGGSFTDPSVKTDLTSGVKNLTKQLVEIEKKKLVNKGKDEVKNVIGNIIGNNTTKSDSTKTNDNNVKDVLNGIISGDKKTDSPNTDNPTTNTVKNVKNVLGGMLGGKKK